MRRFPIPSLRQALSAGAFLAFLASPAQAQDFGLAGHVGTLGIGAGAAFEVNSRLALRAAISVQPWEPNRVVEDVDVTASFASPAYSGRVDLYPFAGAFRLSGGVVHFSEPITLVGTPVGPVEVNGTMYDPADVGDVAVRVMTRESAPYLGVGFGRVSGAGLGVFMDLGVVFQGEPTLDVAFDGPFANQPAFQQNLQVEVAEVEDDISGYKYFPVLSVGVRFGPR